MAKTNSVLTVSDVADELRVSVVSVRAWIGEGRLRHFRCGRVIRIRREWLDDFIRSTTWPNTGPVEEPVPTHG
ncbi:MAG: helix-turn-helix domain-containing protein [Candidatus Brocadiales bacterium]|nr:helix-turn-helix domain-containing protein [Candidatus Bathyanammoxibius sp.]